MITKEIEKKVDFVGMTNDQKVKFYTAGIKSLKGNERYYKPLYFAEVDYQNVHTLTVVDETELTQHEYEDIEDNVKFLVDLWETDSESEEEMMANINEDEYYYEAGTPPKYQYDYYIHAKHNHDGYITIQLLRV